MTRRGILTLDHLAAAARGERRLAPIAFDLLAELQAGFSDANEPALALIYPQLAGGDKGMRTFPQRYRSIDDAIAATVDRLFEPGRTVRVHEMAASNAVTSLELFDRLRHRETLSFLASDHFDAIHVVRSSRSAWKAVFDAEHRLLQFVGRRAVIMAGAHKPERHLLWRVAASVLTGSVGRKAAGVLGDRHAAERGIVQRIPLFHPRCLAVARADGRFALRRDSIFAPCSGPCEVLRLMGVVRRYSADRIRAVFAAIAPLVVDGGLLVAGYNRDYGLDRVPTTIFRREGGGFTALQDLWGGYEHRGIVLSVTVSDTPQIN